MDNENGFGFAIRFMTGFNYKMKLHVMQVRNVMRAFFRKSVLTAFSNGKSSRNQPMNEPKTCVS